MKVLPIDTKIGTKIKNTVKDKTNITVKPIKNYTQYLKEYGIKGE